METDNDLLGKPTKKKYTKPDMTKITVESLVKNIWEPTEPSDFMKANEELNLESVYKQQLSQLRSKFPSIPEDLTNKRVIIRYEGDNGVYQNIILYSDGLVVDEINGKNIAINKINGEREGSAISKRNGTFINEKFNFYEFNQGIEKIIENADKCEVIVEELDHSRFSIDE